jgi:hypothetical protein
MQDQLSRGMKRRVLYIENKTDLIDGEKARIGWASFSKSGRSIHYRGRTLQKSTQLVSGNFFDTETGDEYWVSGVKQKGSNAHPAESAVRIVIDPDALEEVRKIRGD